jgi:uncharacterized small protein (DUF1192 family)
MGFMDNAKQAMETATARAKEGIHELQTKRELAQAYGDLGKLAFELSEAGEISHERIGGLVERIRRLESDLERPGPEPDAAHASERDGAEASEPDAADAPPDPPPPMP